MRLGAHMSTAGGTAKAFERGSKVGCQTIQIFTKNSNQWHAKSLMKEEIDLFFKEKERTGIDPVFSHASYLINLGSPDKDLYEKSKEALFDELRRAEKLKLVFVVLHPGAALNSPLTAALKRIAAAINDIFEKTKEFNVKLLLENTAGQGSCVGHQFEDLSTIMKSVEDKKRIGICFDTCHAFQAGYDLRTDEGYQKTFHEFGNLIGLSNLLAFHLNDSKKELGGRVDRHQHIGKGYLGIRPFQLLMNDKRFEEIPMVLETPKGEECLEDRDALNLLRSLQCT